jgi:hypothetical protein
MAGEVYGAFEFAQKGYTRGSDIGKGQMGISHMNPPLFLEFKLIKLHTHGGVDSQKLGAEATPEAVKGFKYNERIERGVATWAGGASASGSVALTFGVPFNEAPTVIVVPAANDVNIQVGTNMPTETGVTILWKDDTAGGHTSVPITYLVIGR